MKKKEKKTKLEKSNGLAKSGKIVRQIAYLTPENELRRTHWYTSVPN